MEFPLQKRVSAGLARSNLDKIMNDVYQRGDNVIIERSGKPLVVMIPFEMYENIRQARFQL